MQTIPDPPPPVTTPETAEATLRALLARWPEWDVAYSAPLGAWTAEKQYPSFRHMLSALTPAMLAARIEAAEAAASVRWVAAASGPDYRLLGGDEADGQ